MNSAQSNFEIPKTLAMKLVEVRDALQLVRDCVQHIQEGRRYYLPALAGQMRGLLIDSDRRAEPRLLQMAAALSFDIDLYCMPDANDYGDVLPAKDDLLFLISGFPFSSEKQFSGQRRTSINEFIEFKFLKYKGTAYSVRSLIEWFANKNGGSHYSKTLPRHFAEILTMDFFGFPDIVM